MQVLVEFDYKAQNIDELDIKKGDIICNVIQKEEGWYEGELKNSGKIGLFPDNFVKTLKIPQTASVSKNLKNKVSSLDEIKNTTNKQNIHLQNNITSPPPPPPPSILNNLHQQQQRSLSQVSKPAKPKSPVIVDNEESKQITFQARVLYSYIPVNDDELAIQENEIVQVIRLVEDGWFEGFCNGKQGVFPSNYVEKVSTEPQKAKSNVPYESMNKANDELLDTNEIDKKKNKKVLGIGLGNIFSGKTIELKTKENFTNQKSALTVDQNERHNERHSERQIADSIAKNETKQSTKIKARVLYDYAPTQSDELRLVVGDFIYILDKNLDDEGWYRGESASTGEIGVFPDNFIEEISESTKLVSSNSLMNKKEKSAENSNRISNEYIINEVQHPTSLTNSTASNSSSNNSLTKLTPFMQNSVLKTQQNSSLRNSNSNTFITLPAPEEINNRSKSQSELSEEMEEFNNQTESNKLTHIKKAKQQNKRPPSFRKKKVLNETQETETKEDDKKSVSINNGSLDIESVSSKIELENSNNLKIAQNDEPSVENIKEPNEKSISGKITSPSVVLPSIATPVIVSSPITCHQSQMVNLSGSGINRQITNLSQNGTISEMSMATMMTTLDNNSNNNVIVEEMNALREELLQTRNENKEIKNDFTNFKSLHDEQMQKMQRKLLDLISEIDEEKKTRLAFQVELERLKKNVNSL